MDETLNEIQSKTSVPVIKRYTKWIGQKNMIKKRNKTILIIIGAMCLAILSLIFSTGIRFLNGRNNDKERQREIIKDITLKGIISNVTDKDIYIMIDTVSNNYIIFPTEYIPPYHFDISSKGTCLILNRERLRLYNIKKGNYVEKEAGTDSIIIDREKYTLFDWEVSGESPGQVLIPSSDSKKIGKAFRLNEG